MNFQEVTPETLLREASILRSYADTLWSDPVDLDALYHNLTCAAEIIETVSKGVSQ